MKSFAQEKLNALLWNQFSGRASVGRKRLLVFKSQLGNYQTLQFTGLKEPQWPPGDRKIRDLVTPA